MILTGKCKEEFEKWYEDPKRDHVGLRRKVQWFYTLSFAMQYSVLVDFFDSVDIHIDAICIDNNDGAWHYSAWVGREEVEPFNTRNEARTEAIKKADGLFNEKL